MTEEAEGARKQPATRLERLLHDKLAELPRGDVYLMGLSGGRDSMALWDVLTRMGFRLAVCHVNHGWRKEASRRDATWVEARARDKGQPFYLREVPAGVAPTETSAREQRLAFFAETMRKTGAAGVFLAHHATDQVESMLLALLRGAGLKGLAGMQERQYMTRPEELVLLRPLLDVPREVLEEHLAARDVPWREDASNEEAFTARNRIRLRLLPALREVLDRDPVPALLRFATLAAGDDAFLSGWAEEAFAGMRDDARLPVARLRELPVPVRSRVFLAWLASLGIAGSAALVGGVDALVEPGAARWSLNVPGGGRIRRKSGWLRYEAPV
jgi:tRNA(Ile)-lysidine synthase